MDKNLQGNFDFLDIISLIGFIVQINNIEKDEEYNEYIHLVIKTIANEVDKLHKENDIIMKQNEEIIDLLGDVLNAIND